MARKTGVEKKLQGTIGQLRMAEMEVHDLEAQVDELRDQIELPKLKKKLEGKFFKYDNGYDRERRWWLYTKVIQVKGVHEIIADRFETEANGQNSFQHGEILLGETTLGKRISKREYYTALQKFKSKLIEIK